MARSLNETTVGAVYVHVHNLDELTVDNSTLTTPVIKVGPVSLIIMDRTADLAGRLRALADQLEPVTVPA